MSIFQAVLHVACQLVGAVVGAALVESIGNSLKGVQGLSAVDATKTLWQLTGGATNFVRMYDAAGADTEANIAVAPAFVGEMLGTMLLVIVVMVIGDQERGAKDKHNAILGPLAAGLAVFIANITLIPLTNCSINPARTFGPAVIFGDTPAVTGLKQTPWSYMWLFWLAPLAGATLAAVIWQVAFTAHDDGWVHCRKPRPSRAAGGIEDWSSSGRNIVAEIAASPTAGDSLDAAEVAVAA
jgi:aquaporin PIP